MKKIAAILSVVAIATITLVSCSKKGNYTCSCTIDFGGVTQTSSVPYTDVKKSDAEKSCQQVEDAGNATVPGSTTCNLN